MSETYAINDYFKKNGLISEEEYFELYKQSVEDNEGFWAEQAGIVDWIKPFTKVKDVSFAKDDLHIRWYEDGELNVCYNCVDRHLADKADQAAIIWEGDDPGTDLTISYGELHKRVCRFANVLKSIGAKKGDRVTIYMPMMRAHRRCPFRRIRRIFAGRTCRPHHRLQIQHCHYRRRRCSWRQVGAPESQCRCGGSY
jgi:acetyl-CoA synthetase